MVAAPDVLADAGAVQETGEVIKSKDIAALNLELRAAGLPEIDLPK